MAKRISTSYGTQPFLDSLVYSKSAFLISGECDFVIPPEQLQQHIKDIPERRECEVISGTDHFWWGYETEVAQKVAQFFIAGFNPRVGL